MAATLDPQTARQAAEATLARDHYDLTRNEASEFAADWLFELLEPVLRFLGWLFEGLVELGENLHATSPILYWIVIVVLVLILFGLIAHIIYTFRVALTERQRGRTLTWSEAKEEGPERLERLAAKAAAAGDRVLALTLYFKAAVLRLEMAREGAFKPAATNREYVRRYAEHPAHEPLQRMTTLLERWYAGKDLDEAEFSSGEAAFRDARRLAVSG